MGDKDQNSEDNYSVTTIASNITKKQIWVYSWYAILLLILLGWGLYSLGKHSSDIKVGYEADVSGEAEEESSIFDDNSSEIEDLDTNEEVDSKFNDYFVYADYTGQFSSIYKIKYGGSEREAVYIADKGSSISGVLTSPNSKKFTFAVYTSGNEESKRQQLYIYDIEKGSLTLIAENSGVVFQTWSPNSKYLIYVNTPPSGQGSAQTIVYNLETGEGHRATYGYGYGVTFNNQGTGFAFIKSITTNDNGNVTYSNRVMYYDMAAFGTTDYEAPIIDDKPEARELAFSTNDDRLLYTYREPAADKYVYVSHHLESGAKTILTKNYADSYKLQKRYSPDGKQKAYVKVVNPGAINPSLAVVIEDIDGSIRTVYQGDEYTSVWQWHPNGEDLVLLGESSKGTSYYLMNIKDPSQVTEITVYATGNYGY